MKLRTNRLLRGVRSLSWALLLGSVLALTSCDNGDIRSLPEARALTCPSTGGDVLLLGQDGGSGLIGEVLAYLTPMGFNSIATYDNQLATPTLGDLIAYDAVLAWTDSDAADPTLLGDVLADYVDAGGKVAIASFGLSNQVTLLGRILTPAYTPLTPVDSFYADDSMGAVLVPAHPIMAGVTSLGAFYRDETTPNPGALVLATWLTSGSPVVAVNAAQTVVGLSPTPAYTTTASGDYPRLFANTLHCLAVR